MIRNKYWAFLESFNLMYNFKLIEWLILLAYEFEIIMISINIENSNSQNTRNMHDEKFQALRKYQNGNRACRTSAISCRTSAFLSREYEFIFFVLNCETQANHVDTDLAVNYHN